MEETRKPNDLFDAPNILESKTATQATIVNEFWNTPALIVVGSKLQSLNVRSTIRAIEIATRQLTLMSQGARFIGHPRLF